MKKPKISTVLTVVVLFAVFFIFAFPFENLKGYIFSKIYSQTNILIVADEIYPSFFGWPGIGIKNVNVSIPLGENELELASEKLTFKVGLLGLFPPIPSASMNLKKLKKGGDLYVDFGQGGKKLFVILDAQKVNLEQLGLPGLTEPIQGLISSDTNVTVDQSDFSKSSGKISLKGENLKVPPYMVEGMPGLSFLIPGMKVGKLDGQIALKNGSIDLTTFKFGEPNSDLSGSFSGEIKLAQDIQRSSINLTVRLQLSSKILQDPQAKTFVSFLEGYQTKTPGDYAMRWNAMISELTGVTIKVLPDKVPN